MRLMVIYLLFRTPSCKEFLTDFLVPNFTALMEYHCSDDRGVASRIFEKGMDTFGDEIEFVLRYLGFLISINDKNSAYARFSKFLPSLAYLHLFS